MRSSRETELAQQFPMHVVCSWIGNSTPVAMKHYLTVTDADYEKAVQNQVQYPHGTACNGGKQETQNPGFPGVYKPLPYPTEVVIPPRGVEPLFSD